MITSSTTARIEPVALGEGLQRLRSEVNGVPVLQLAVALSTGGTNRIDDDCSCHHVPFVAVASHPREAYSSRRGSVTTVNEITKNMDRWLGDGGMALIGAVGATFDAYGVDGEDLGWVVGDFAPTELACNPHGTAQAGVHALLLDASMNFALTRHYRVAIALKRRSR